MPRAGRNLWCKVTCHNIFYVLTIKIRVNDNNIYIVLILLKMTITIWRENRDIDGWHNSGADIKTKHETKCEPFKLMFDMTSWKKKIRDSIKNKS